MKQKSKPSKEGSVFETIAIIFILSSLLAILIMFAIGAMEHQTDYAW